MANAGGALARGLGRADPGNGDCNPREAMKPFALLSLALLGCGLPAPPAPGPMGAEPTDASLPPPTDDVGGGEVTPPAADAAPPTDGQSQAGERVLTQTETNVVEPGNSIACEDGANFESSWYRIFDLSAEGITSSFQVTQVAVGVEVADGGDDGVQPVEAVLHTLAGDLQGGDALTTLATSPLEVADATARVEFPIAAEVPAGTPLVVEIRVPDGGETGDLFIIGANDDGQTAPGFIKAPACGDDDPRDIADIGRPDVHLIIEVTGQ